MRPTAIFLLFLSMYFNTLGQNSADLWRFNPAVSADDLQDAQTVNDLSAELWQMMRLPNQDRQILDEKIKFTMGFQVQNKRSYASLVKVVSSSIKAVINGNEVTLENNGSNLSQEQKDLLKGLRNGDEFDVKLTFEHEGIEHKGRVAEASTFVTVLPHRAADFPGGIKAFKEHLDVSLWSKVRKDKSFGSINMARVSFQVDKVGKVSKVKILRSASSQKGDDLILKVFSNMPTWIPAKNIRGELIEQEVKYSLRGC